MSDLEINTVQFSQFYSLFAWPNIILCMVGGFLMDRVLGIRWGSVIFCAIATTGQVIIARLQQRNCFLKLCDCNFVLSLKSIDVCS